MPIPTLVDFETYYEKSSAKKRGLSVVDDGLHNYVRDSHAYLVSIVGDDGLQFCGEIPEAKARFGIDFWNNGQRQFIAANSNFDRAWARKEFDCLSRDWDCVLDRAAVAQHPRNLADLIKVLFGIKLDKGARDDMNGVRWEDCTQKDRIREYCLQDAVMALKAWHALPPMSDVETEIAKHTRRANWDGVFLDHELITTHVELLHMVAHGAIAGIPWRNTHAIASPIGLAAWCESKGIPAPKSRSKTDEECEFLVGEHPELNEVIMTMRRHTKANSLIKKAQRALRIYSTDMINGAMPMDLRYCGAPHTRRWSSRGVNVQNLDREPFKVELPLEPKQLSVFRDRGLKIKELSPGSGIYEVPIHNRNWVIPGTGKVFVSADLSQVEPRCLNWLVGNDPMMALMAQGFSVYEAYARQCKNWKGSKGTLKAEVGVTAYTKIKNEVLGLGYGMGASKYSDYADVPMAEAQTTVDSFRRMNAKIVAFWRQLDQVIARAALSDHHLSVTMPSGESLQYFDVRAKATGGYEGFVVKGDYGAMSKQNRLWGGTLAENVTQRMARDILAGAILSIEKTVAPVAFTAHDETNTPVDKADAEDAKKEISAIMTRTPVWAQGIALQVEATLLDRYDK